MPLSTPFVCAAADKPPKEAAVRISMYFNAKSKEEAEINHIPVVISMMPDRMQANPGIKAVNCPAMEAAIEKRIIYPPSRVIVSKL